MGGSQGEEDLAGDFDGAAEGKASRGQQLLAEVATLEGLHDDEGETVLCLADLENLYDVGMAYRGRSPSFAPKAFYEQWIVGVIVPDDLDGDLSTEGAILGEKDPSHAPRSQGLLHDVPSTIEG